MCGRWLCARKFSDLNFLTHTTSRLKKSILWRIFAICYANSRCLQNGIFSKQRMDWGFCRLSAKTPVRLPFGRRSTVLRYAFDPFDFVATLSGFIRLSSLRVDARSSHLSSLWAISYALYARPTLGACAFGAVALTHNPSTAGAPPPNNIVPCFASMLAFGARTSLERPRLLFAYCCCIIAFLLLSRSFIIYI